MGLRSLLQRSAKAVVGEIVDRVLERRGSDRPAAAPARSREPRRWPEAKAEPPAGLGPAEAGGPRIPEGPEDMPPIRPPGQEPPARDPREEPPARDPREEPPARDPREEPPVEPPPDERDRPPVEPPPDERDEPPLRTGATITAPDGEPILTRTMAGLLAAQGFHERALRIYDHLCATAPEDGDLAAEAGGVRRRMDEAEDAPPDQVAAVPVRESLLVSWKVTDRSVDRARRVLGDGGTLTARLVVVARSGHAAVRSETREHAPVPSTGEHLFPDLPPGARCTASIGLRAGPRFVSVAHSRVVPT